MITFIPRRRLRKALNSALGAHLQESPVFAHAPTLDKVCAMADRRFHPFPNTHWSLVQRAGFAEQDTRREALQVLLERYQPAMRSYLLFARRLDEGTAEEVLQAFIADRILERELIRLADQRLGRFRTFLITSLKNFAITHYRAEKLRAHRRRKVDGSTKLVSPADADAIVEAAWARELIHGVIEAMKEECRKSGRQDLWAVFERRLLAKIVNNQKPLSYQELATQLKLSSPVQAANLLVTAKRMYIRLLRLAVSEYERDPSNVDQEIADLWKSLGGSSSMEDS